MRHPFPLLNPTTLLNYALDSSELSTWGFDSQTLDLTAVCKRIVGQWRLATTVSKYYIHMVHYTLQSALYTYCDIHLRLFGPGTDGAHSFSWRNVEFLVPPLLAFIFSFSSFGFIWSEFSMSVVLAVWQIQLAVPITPRAANQAAFPAKTTRKQNGSGRCNCENKIHFVHSENSFICFRISRRAFVK